MDDQREQRNGNGAACPDDYSGYGAQQKRNHGFILSKYTIYKTTETMYVVGSNREESVFKILQIDLTVPQDRLSVLEDHVYLSRSEIMEVLSNLEEASEDGLHKELTCYGLLGFIRFTACYYLVVVTKYSQVAVLGGHSILHIDGKELIPVAHTYRKPDKASTEMRLMSTFQNLDLTRAFYSSYTYDLTNTLQTNILREKLKAVNRTDITIPSNMTGYNEMFMWNHHLLEPVFACIDTVYDWFQPVIHGFIDQVNVSVLGKSVYITIIARRSHHFAGARFLKRGVNNQGFVANEVETEQIVADMILTPFHGPGNGYFDSDRYTSFVQHRGSIPLYWTQEASNLATKPPIEINALDPFYSSAALHFDMLFQRYGGGTIQVLNLIKIREKLPRESKLLRAFEECIEYLNRFLPTDKKISYTSWDMSRASKQDGQHVIEFLEKYASESVELTGIFHNGKDFKNTKIQQGICRSNCIDCLDRTNAAQFVLGKRALGAQLKALAINDTSYLEYDSDITNILTELFHDLGDTIALQYGGSHLVNTMETYRKINQWKSHSRDMIESIKRFYSNSFVDAQRQEAINLFLGHYVWKQGNPELWKMNADYDLHNDSKVGKLRRSYTHWWNAHNIKGLRETLMNEIVEVGHDLTRERVKQNIKSYTYGFDNYWNEYYLPKEITFMRELFVMNMNSTRMYHNKGVSLLSPFEAAKQNSLNQKLKELTTRKVNSKSTLDTPLNEDEDNCTYLDEREISLYNQKLFRNANAKYCERLNENSKMDTLHTLENLNEKLEVESFFGNESDIVSFESFIEDELVAFSHLPQIDIDFQYYRKITDTSTYTPMQDLEEYTKIVSPSPDKSRNDYEIQMLSNATPYAF